MTVWCTYLPTADVPSWLCHHRHSIVLDDRAFMTHHCHVSRCKVCSVVTQSGWVESALGPVLLLLCVWLVPTYWRRRLYLPVSVRPCYQLLPTVAGRRAVACVTSYHRPVQSCEQPVSPAPAAGARHRSLPSGRYLVRPGRLWAHRPIVGALPPPLPVRPHPMPAPHRPMPVSHRRCIAVWRGALH